MARTYATVGQMLTYAVDKSVHAAGFDDWSDRHRRPESMLRHMLEFVLMAPRSRSAFLRTAVRTEQTTGSIVAAPRLRRSAPDLIAELLPTSSRADDGARLGITLNGDGPVDPARLQTVRTALGRSAHHRLLSISRRADLRDLEGELPEGVQAISWGRLSRRMVTADPGHAALWETIGEIGENTGGSVVQFPVDAGRLLSKPRIAREFRDHLDVLQLAGRALLGTSPRFSTRRGQTGAHLRAGVGPQRTGIEFGDVEHGSPVRLLRTGQEPASLRIGLLRSEQDLEAARERLENLAARPSWRTASPARVAPEELIGSPAAPEVEGARLLLWAVFDPMLLRDRGFDLAPARRQSALSATTLALRLHHREEQDEAVYRIWVGGQRRWEHLIPKVTREATDRRPEETYAVAPRKKQSTAEFVGEVHRALRSLTIA